MTNANRKRQLAVETAAKEGLRASVPLYLAAAEAFAQEDRPAQSVELLGELLRAKEKRRGLLGRIEKNPLGGERMRVAVKYAEFARTTSPTEDTLEMLEDLSGEFIDSPVIRRANADGLRNAGYASDAIEEYSYCAKLEPEEGDIAVRLSELYAALGRNDDALEQLRLGIKLHAAHGEFEQVADRAMRFIDLNPDDLDDVFASLELIPGDVLKKHVPSLDHLGVLVRRDPAREADWRAGMEQRLVDLYARVLGADGRNAAARRGINVLGPHYLADVEARLRIDAARRPVATEQAALVPNAGAQQTADTQPPELVEKSPGELVAEEVPERVATAAQDAKPVVQAATPAVQATPPVVQDVKPVAQEAKPVAEEAKPVAEEAKPVAEEAKPVAEEAKPIAAEPKPVAQGAPAPPTEAAPVAASVAPGSPAISAPSRGLYAFALRKAQEQFDAGSYPEAAQACDRILKRGEIGEVLQLLARCYIKLERKPDAVKASLRFADTLAPHDLGKAIEALTEMISALPDPALILRRSQLLSSMRQVEFVGKER